MDDEFLRTDFRKEVIGTSSERTRARVAAPSRLLASIAVLSGANIAIADEANRMIPWSSRVRSQLVRIVDTVTNKNSGIVAVTLTLRIDPDGSAHDVDVTETDARIRDQLLPRVWSHAFLPVAPDHMSHRISVRIKFSETKALDRSPAAAVAASAHENVSAETDAARALESALTARYRFPFVEAIFLRRITDFDYRHPGNGDPILAGEKGVESVQVISITKIEGATNAPVSKARLRLCIRTKECKVLELAYRQKSVSGKWVISDVGVPVADHFNWLSAEFDHLGIPKNEQELVQTKDERRRYGERQLELKRQQEAQRRQEVERQQELLRQQEGRRQQYMRQ